MRTPNGHPGAQAMPQIRSQVNISGQQRLSNVMLTNQRITSNQAMQVQVQAQARALAAAQAQAQAHPTITSSLAAGAAPALTAHLTPNYNTVRASSTSPGLPQQSPPLPQAVASNATSPRPPSAQAQALAALTPQVQASIASAQRTAPTMAHYYSNMQNLQAAHLTPEQLQHAMNVRAALLSQVRRICIFFLALLIDAVASSKPQCSNSKHNNSHSKMAHTLCHRTAYQ
jgi:chromatin modification-related protein VID21